MGLFNHFPYTNFHDLNLGWAIEKIEELITQGETLYSQLVEWKDDTDTDLDTWKTNTLAALEEWEQSLTTALEQWKSGVEIDFASYEAQFQTIKGRCEAWTTGQINGVDVPASDETYHNNAEYYANQAGVAAAELEEELTTLTPISINSWQIGKTINSAGSIANSTGFAYSTYILPINPGSKLAYTGTLYDDNNNRDFICYVCEYQAGYPMTAASASAPENLIQRTNIVAAQNHAITLSNNTYGIAVAFGRSVPSGQSAITFVEADLDYFGLAISENTFVAFDSRLTKVEDKTIRKNVFDPLNFVESGSISTSDGVTVTSGGRHTTDFIEAMSSKLTVMLKPSLSTATTIITILFYDSDNQYIGYNTHQLNPHTFVIGLPSNCAKIKANTNYGSPSANMFAFSFDDWEEYTVYSDDETSLNTYEMPPVRNKLKFQTVVNFGDSIFGLRRPPNSLSDFIALYTGATCHNVGFGGCNMASKTDVKYDPFCMYRLAYAIANNDFALQEAQVTATGVPSYYRDALTLLESIDFSKVDIITIAYGTNDFSENTALDNTLDPDDTDTLAGALRYSIETLLTAFPSIRIFVLTPIYRFYIDGSNQFVDDSNTHTNSNGDLLTDFVEKEIAVANEYQLDYIDDYYNTGINKFNRSFYFPSNDGTHPRVTGLQALAQHIAHHLY